MKYKSFLKNEWMSPLFQALVLSLFFALPFEHTPTLSLAGYTVKISNIIGLFLLFYLAVSGLYKKLFEVKGVLFSDKLLFAFWAVSVVSVLFSPSLKRSVVIVGMWAFVFLLYVVISRLLTNKLIRQEAEKYVIVSTVLVCLFGIYQFLGDSLGIPAEFTALRYLYTKAIFGFPRIQSVGLEPLYFGDFLLVPLFLILRRYVGEKGLATKTWWITVLVFINLILGIARSIYAALLITVPCFLIYLFTRKENTKEYRQRAFGIVLSIAVAAIISMGLVTFANGRKATQNFVGHAAVNDTKVGDSVPGRLATYKLAIKFFREKPVLGVGVGGFGASTQRSSEDIAKTGYGTVNNEYLEILTETGAIGFVFFAAFAIVLLASIVKALKVATPEEKMALVPVFLGVCAIFIQYNFFSTLYIAHVWVFLGLLNSQVLSIAKNHDQKG